MDSSSAVNMVYQINRGPVPRRPLLQLLLSVRAWVSLYLPLLLFAALALPASAQPKAKHIDGTIPLLSELKPRALEVRHGRTEVLQATLSPRPTTAGTLIVTSDNPSLVQVPRSIGFVAGQSRVAIPVLGEGVGQGNVTVQLGTSSLKAPVNVVPSAARLVSLQPSQASLQQGASGQFVVSVGPRRSHGKHQIHLTSSNPAVLSVPERVTVASGEGSATFMARGLAPGNAQILARLHHGRVGSTAISQVQVVSAAPGATSLLPVTSLIHQGAVGQLTVKISAAQSTATTVALLARTPHVVTVPGSVVIPPGVTEASFAVKGVAVGNTLIVAALNGSSVEAAVQVTPSPSAIASLEPVTTTLVVSAQGQLTLRLNAAQASATSIALATEPDGIVQVPAEMVIPAGEAQGSVQVSALAVGQADVVATLNGGTRRSTVSVTPKPVEIAALLPNPLGIQAGASANLTIRLNAVQDEAITVQLATSQPDVVRVPAEATIPAGQIEQAIVVQGLAEGTSQITATSSGSSRGALINVTLPPPRIAVLEPASQDLPKGKLGKLKITLDRAPKAEAIVQMTNGNAGVLEVPALITIPAGQTAMEVPLVAMQLGQAGIRATLNGSVGNAVVNVVPPEVVNIALNPASVNVSPGQSVEVRAVATYSDGSTQDVTSGAGTAWSTGGAEIATVATNGYVTGVSRGETTISAMQSVLATYGKPNPSAVVGNGTVTVGAPSPLALSTSKTQLLVGETVMLSITTPFPAASTAIVVSLSTSGTGALQVPASATIAPGLTSVSVPVKAMAAGAAAVTATATQFGAGQLGFTIANVIPTGVNITSISPATAAVGTNITMTGSGFASPVGGNTVVFQGNVPAVIQSGSATQLVVKVPDAAQTGPITVTNSAGSAQSAIFTVIREQDFGIQASPAYLKVIQGSNAIATLNLGTSGTRPYQGLAKLTASGQPTSVRASFEPATQSAYQTGKLILTADPSTPLGTAVVTIKAEATLDGLPWVRESRVNIEVVSKQNVTGVKGRFVTPGGSGIGGVIVRQDTTTNQVVTDAAGNFTLTGLASGVTTLRFDATPANALYPIWPFNVSVEANQLLTMSDWVINPPPADDKFKAINNSSQDQAVTDERYPGFAVVLPAGVTITGWDGVKKTRIAVERIDPDKLPVGPPPFPMKEAYQLYFGTPMGGIPSSPIPVQLPNVAEKEPGEKVEIWWFDGSPMGGTGDWKMAGLGTVSADGKTVASDPGVGLPRFCGVCGLVSLSCPPPPVPPQPPPTCSPPSAGNPVDLFTGQELASTSGLSCGSPLTPIETGMKYNPVDAFNNRAGTIASFGYGWTFGHDISFLPFAGVQKRLVMPGGQFINMVDDGTGKYRPVSDPRHSGSYAQDAGGGKWEVVQKGGTKWQFEEFAGITGLLRGGPPMFLTRITDANGNITNIARQSNGRILSVAGADGRGVSMGYSGGFVSSITDHTGRRQSYEYTSAQRISKITDAQGRVTEHEYQDLPRYSNSYSCQSPCEPPVFTACESDIAPGWQGLSKIKYPSSDTPTQNTYGTDRIVKQITSTGQEWKFSYRRSGACVAKVYDAPRQSVGSTQAYDFTCKAGQTLTTSTCTASSGEMQCTEMVVGVCPEIDSEENRAAGWRFYGGVNLETTVRKPDGQKTVTRFNARGMPTEIIDELGQSTRYIYDPQQQRVKTIDALGRESKFEYDVSGNRTAQIDPLGRRSETAYEPNLNNPTSATRYLMGVPSTQGGQQLSHTPVISSMAYDGKGNLTAALDPTGVLTQIGYDAKGLVSQIVLPANAGASTVPVVSAGVSSSVLRTARKLTLAHNAAGEVALVTDAQGNETRFSTDSLGRQTGATDPLGYSSQTQYNELDQVTKVTNALSQDSRITYDSAARTTGVVNPANVTIEGYTHDAQGRVIGVTDAAGQSSSIAYDSSGRPASVTDRKGQVTSLTYNERGQIAQLSKPGQIVGYQYDAIGRLTEVRDGSTVSAHQYDSVDRLIQTDTATAAGSHRLQYEYDSLDRVTKRTLSGTGIAQPEATSYAWDLAGRLLSHGTLVGGQPHATRYEYDVAGRLAARKVQAGNQPELITQRYGYDGLERLAQIKYVKAEGTAGEQLIEQIDYGYDVNGRRTTRTTLNNNGTGAGETPMTASYDAANRLTAVTLNIQGATKTYTLSYDANGNLTQKVNASDPSDQTTYTWDADNRLTNITQQSLTAAFGYDAFGRRIQNVITRAGQAPATVQYVYEGSQALGEIRDGKLSHRLLTGLSLDETIARIAVNASGQKDAAASRVYMTDALNSVIGQLGDDGNANIANSYGYSPYGESTTIGPDATSNPIQYTSRENDGTGLMFYRARYYDPVLKRFISRDPIGLAGGMNDFAYVDGDPINWTDPLGLAKSGIPTKVGNSTVRIDKPHVPGQQTHAHVDSAKGGKGPAVNADGTGSHGATPEDVQNIPNKVKDFLRNKGFNLCPPVPLLICPLCNILMPQPQGPS
jgi:RHS repeat-associated protein